MVRVGHQDRRQVRLPDMSDMSEAYENSCCYGKTGEAPRKYGDAMLIPASAMRRRHGTLVGAGYGARQDGDEQDFDSPLDASRLDGWAIGGTKRAVRSAWHSHQPLTRVLLAAHDAAVRLQRHALRSRQVQSGYK